MLLYDYVIIGAGPTGLTLAWYLAKYCPDKKILIVESENTIGGCHRVRRVDGLFTEHGPRIIISNYFCLGDMLRELGLTFDEMYAQSSFSVGMRLRKMFMIFSWRELIILGIGKYKIFN